jgi:hypothetical protein
MKTKRNERTCVMRGQTHRQEWAIVYQDGKGKRWREYTCGRAGLMICGFVAFADYNKRKNWNTRSGALPVRLLAPGGIIAAEHSVKPRAKLLETGKLRPSIELPAEPTKLRAGSYPFLTICKPRPRG